MPEGQTSIHAVVVRISAGSSSRSDVAYLVAACHRMAVAYLRAKVASGTLSPGRFGLRLDDLALDGIADLFTRDGKGAYPLLCGFVQRAAAGGDSEVSAEIALRRFVCSVVNRRIFDLYRQFDPTLARIIRNVKLAAVSHPRLASMEHLGEKVLVPRSERELNSRLPVIAPEMLSAELRMHTGHPKTLRCILTGLADILAEQTVYRRMVPVTQAALAIRALLVPTLPEGEEESGMLDISEDDARAAVQRTVSRLKAGRGATYVHRGRLTAGELDAHMSAVRDVLLRGFDDPEPDHRSFFEFLRRHISNLTRTEYAGRHRTILEYLIRCARASLADRLEVDF